MSAFVVDKAHIDALVSVANAGPAGRHHWAYGSEYADLDAMGQMLGEENLRSVRYRYPSDDDPENVPGPVAQYWRVPYAWSRPHRQPTTVEALSILRCYEYQACECPDWPLTRAYKWCEQLRLRLIVTLPGYEDAPWEWTAPEGAGR